MMVYVFCICYSYFSYCHICVGPSSHNRCFSLILTVWGMPSIASETEGSCCCCRFRWWTWRSTLWWKLSSTFSAPSLYRCRNCLTGKPPCLKMHGWISWFTGCFASRLIHLRLLACLSILSLLCLLVVCLYLSLLSGHLLVIILTCAGFFHWCTSSVSSACLLSVSCLSPFVSLVWPLVGHHSHLCWFLSLVRCLHLSILSGCWPYQSAGFFQYIVCMWLSFLATC